MKEIENNNERELTAERVVTFLHRIGAYDYFKNVMPSESEPCNFEDFKDFIIRINGIARNIPIKERMLDGEDVELGGFVGSALLPHHSDKEDLLRKAFDITITLKDQEKARLLIPLIITAVHPFEDANGRTARIAHLLLSQLDSEKAFEDILRKSLGEDGRYEVPDLNPSLVRREVIDVILKRHNINPQSLPHGLTRVRTSELLESKRGREFDRIFDIDTALAFLAVYQYVNANGLLEMVIKTKQDVAQKSLPENYKAISLKKLEEICTDVEWDEIFQSYYKLKKESVEVLTEMFADPDQLLVGNRTLLEIFLERVRENMEEVE